MQAPYRMFTALLIVTAGLALGSCAQRTGTDSVDLQHRLQAELEELHAEYRFPGATAALVTPEGKVVAAAVGVSDRDTRASMTPESRMLAASIGKSFVGATAVALVQEGKLDLDAPISTWLGDEPWFSRLPNHDSITLFQLLTHSSGLPDHVYTEAFAQEFGKKWNAPGNPFQPADLIGFVLDKPALFEAGKGFAYSDTGYLLVGMIIEAVSGSSLYEEIIDRFLVPLRLGSTSPSNFKVLPGLVAGYLPEDNQLALPPVTTVAPGIMAWNPAIEWAGGGFASTSKDLAVWAKALYEGKAIAGGKYLDDLFRSVPVSADAPGVRYGAGVAIREAGPFGKSLGHGGGIPGYSSSMRYYPDHRVSVAFQVNVDGGMSGGSSLVEDSENFLEEMEQRLASVATGYSGP
jgi:D-alanyl-D-alanine carboxypeptidase